MNKIYELSDYSLQVRSECSQKQNCSSHTYTGIDHFGVISVAHKIGGKKEKQEFKIVMAWTGFLKQTLSRTEEVASDERNWELVIVHLVIKMNHSMIELYIERAILKLGIRVWDVLELELEWDELRLRGSQCGKRIRLVHPFCCFHVIPLPCSSSAMFSQRRENPSTHRYYKQTNTNLMSMENLDLTCRLLGLASPILVLPE